MLKRSLVTATVAVISLALAGAAQADTTIGSATPPSGSAAVPCSSSGVVFGPNTTDPSTPFSVPAGGGTITQFSTSTSGATAGSSVTFLVLRQTSPTTYTVVGVDTETLPNPLPAGGVASFTLAAPIAVNAGDILGLYSGGGGATCFFDGGSTPAGDTLFAGSTGSSGTPTTGQTVTQLGSTSPPGYVLNVAATVNQGSPYATARPTISGSAQQGQTLTESHGSYNNSPTGYMVQFLRCDSAGNNCVAIQGATGQTYTLTAADVGHTIRVSETASNSLGSSSPNTSNPTGVVSGAPIVTTGSSSGMRTTTAALNGTVNPQGAATSYHFEYGTSTAYGSSTASQSAGAGFGDQAASAVISGLKPGTTYHFRIVATNAVGTTVGVDKTFTTPKALVAPLVTTGPAQSVGAKSATLTGLVTPEGSATSYEFQYGTSNKYGKTTATRSVGAGTSALKVRFRVTGLRPGAAYHYRLVASNANGEATGKDRTFNTKAVISVAGLASSGCMLSSARSVVIRVKSLLDVATTVELDGKAIAHGARTLRLRLSAPKAGAHTLRVTTTGKAGTSSRTVRFAVCRTTTPTFTG